jgi:UDP:flavonoid glycosyltransferase YjiC (YdhE family)
MRKHINALLWTKPLQVCREILKDLGTEIPDNEELTSDVVYTWPDRFLQMCPPSTQYPRSDAPKTFGFTGGLPRLPKNPQASPSASPTWWTEVIDKPANTDIVLVSQGTVELNYNNLILPTLEALTDRPNTLVIVVLGIKGATLDSTVPIPDNARVIDYFPFDDILPHCSVFVHNGGYGGVQHSLSHGIPLVLAGETEDKPEMCAIAEWAGTAVNLKTGKPTAEALRAAINEVIAEPRYKEACGEIKTEIASFDPIKVVVDAIDQVASVCRR